MSEPDRSDLDVVEISAPAAPETLEEVQDRLAALWERRADLSPELTMRFEMGLVEILGNLIEHAYDPLSPGREVAVRIEVGADVVTAVLSDNGKPVAVDLSRVAMPDEDAESGRGLALALAALDHLSYERDGDCNRWHLRCGGAA